MAGSMICPCEDLDKYVPYRDPYRYPEACCSGPSRPLSSR
jgi:hypothetical protein